MTAATTLVLAIFATLITITGIILRNDRRITKMETKLTTMDENVKSPKNR